MTCLPDFLWTDPLCTYLRRRRNRLWMLLVDLERLRSQWHPDDVATWPDRVWASSLGVTERRFALYVAELRELGLMEPQRIALSPCRQAEETIAAPAPSPRPKYPSDERRVRTPQPLRTDSADAPRGAQNDSADTPPHVHAHEGLSLAEPSQASSIQSSSQAKPSLAELPPTPPANNGAYKHRTQPTDAEMHELLRQHRRPDIEEAVRRLQARPNFTGAGNWVKYLTPVLRDIEGEKQERLPVVGMLSTVQGGAEGNSAPTPQPLRTASPPLVATERPASIWEGPEEGFTAWRNSLPSDLRGKLGAMEASG